MQEQTVFKAGNSLAVTIPRKFVIERKLQPGQKVFVESDAEIDLIQVRTRKQTKPSLTPEFKEWLDRVSRKHKKFIKALARV